MNPKHVTNPAGELRQDLVTGKWVAIATARAKRPSSFSESTTPPPALPKYKNDCPFCNLAEFPQAPDVVRLPDDADHWRLHIFENKYPAFTSSSSEVRAWSRGPYRAMEAAGFHEVLATRWHNETDASLSVADLALQLEALQIRYQELMVKPSVNYIQIMKNSGPAAGASLEHPHHQIITTPILPSDVQDMMVGAERYSDQFGVSPFAVTIDFERASGERVVWENDDFVVFCPFASRAPFAMWVAPKVHEPFFQNVSADHRQMLAEALSQALRRLHDSLNDPAYNYFIHSAPCDDTGFVCNTAIYQQFRWYIEILPRFGSLGGFEMGTGMEIVTAMPEESAAFLRDVRLK